MAASKERVILCAQPLTCWILFLQENLSSVVCSYAQTDQHLCFSLIGKYHISTFFKGNFNIPASLCR